MRYLERDGSLAAAIEAIVKRGLAPVKNLNVFPRHEPLAPLLRREEGTGILLFTVDGLPYVFAANVAASRNTLYYLLGARNDEEAYSIVSTFISEGEGYVEELNRFEEYFTYLGSKLELLPALKFYERDGGLYTTSSIVVACGEKYCNASIHRIMVSEDYSYAAIRVVPRHLAALLSKASEKGRGLPTAIVYGVDPVVLLAAASSPPLGTFELLHAAKLLKGMTFCKTPRYGVPVPCTASVVVEAIIGPENGREGPFADILDLYDTVRQQPLVHVDGVYINKTVKPLVNVIVPGGMEHKLLMGLPREAAIYNSVRRVVPYVRKVRLTPASGMWLHAILSIRKLHDGDGKTAAFAALAAHPSLKHVVVVDDDIDPDKPDEVEWAIATRFQADRGLVVVPHARGSTLDPSSADGLTYKIVIDATAPLHEKSKYIKVFNDEGGGGCKSSCS